MADSGIDTVLIRAGRAQGAATISMAPHRASTILFDTVADLDAAKKCRFDKGAPFHGRLNTPDILAFEEATTQFGDGAGVLLSGRAACVLPLVASLDPGDHVLMVDTIYQLARASFDASIARSGVEVGYYDLRAGIEELIRPNTRMICLEIPCSHTFKVQDSPAIAEMARERGVLTVSDSTRATALFCRPLALGVAIVVQSANGLGHYVARVARHRHAIWARDVIVLSGLCAILLGTADHDTAVRFVQRLKLFGTGFSSGRGEKPRAVGRSVACPRRRPIAGTPSAGSHPCRAGGRARPLFRGMRARA